ncbi:MAG TPA: HAD family hydrolase [Hadesarchaea archaeon]|nr:HAD family hydrolase [Hadesarchaea archaeon]
MITAKAVIFDLDCTLLDTLDRFFEVFNELLEKYGKKTLTRDEFNGVYVADTLDDLISGPSDTDREKKLHGFWLELLRRYRGGGPKAVLIPGVKDVLQNLSEMRVPIAVITSCIVPAPELREELSGFGLDKFVGVIVTAHDVIKDLEQGHHFSKVEILRLAAEKLGAEYKDCVVVGDYWNDIRDGKAIGAKTIAVLTGKMRRGLLERYGPDVIIESVRDLPKVVKFEVQNQR